MGLGDSERLDVGVFDSCGDSGLCPDFHPARTVTKLRNPRRSMMIVNGAAKAIFDVATNVATNMIERLAQSRLTMATTRPMISASSRLRSVTEGVEEPG
jgi:hypothetical protein